MQPPATDKQQQVPTSPRQRITSIWYGLCIFGLLFAISEWHSDVTAEADEWVPSSAAASRGRRELLDNDNRLYAEIDDDFTRDSTCREYLMKFLNGTTDAKDECHAYYNAYQAADCEDDQHQSQHKRKHHRDGGTNWTDDDAMIDDYYEAFECCSSIYNHYVANCNGPELEAWKLLGIVVVMVVCGLARSLLRSFGWLWIPDAAACIVLGAVFGGMLRVMGSGDVVNDRMAFSDELFLRVLLPPIVFQCALTIDKRAFRRDLFPIFSFAILGTAFSAIAIGVITHWLTSWIGKRPLPMLDSLLFGSLISSIDPVATLGILTSVGVKQTDTMYTLIFGESLMNDGVAIVMFHSLASHLKEGAEVDGSMIRECFQNFFLVTLGSIVVGMVCAFCCTVYFWALKGTNSAVTEVAVFFCWAFIPYYISDGLELSGIIAIMVMGFMLDYYVIGGFESEEAQWLDYMQWREVHRRDNSVTNSPDPSRWKQVHSALRHSFSGRGHLLEKSRTHVGFVAEVVASLMETAIFAYLGLFLFNDNSTFYFVLNMTAILGCVSSRGVMVVLMSLLTNIFVFFDVEIYLSRACKQLGRKLQVLSRASSHSRYLHPAIHLSDIGEDGTSPLQAGEDEDENEALNLQDDDDDDFNAPKRYLDTQMQLVLILAGVRGAVSFALVENIPVYDAVTKEGSQFKAELKAMTSCSILFTLFVFGSLTYFAVGHGGAESRHSGGGSLTHRLLSEPLDSDDEYSTNPYLVEPSPASSASALEIDSNLPRRPPPPPLHDSSQSNGVHRPHQMSSR